MRRLVLLLLFSGVAVAQEQIPEPSHYYYGGVVLSDDYKIGSLRVPRDTQLNLSRRELSVRVGGQYTREVTITQCEGEGACYGRVDYALNSGSGLLNGDYIRLDGRAGGGPVVGRKLAVRGAPEQWAVWGEQINLGPGAKAAWWVGGDNPQLEGRATDAVPN